MLFSLVALETAVPEPVAEEVAVDDQENILLDVGGLKDDGKGDGPLPSVSEKKTSVDCWDDVVVGILLVELEPVGVVMIAEESGCPPSFTKSCILVRLKSSSFSSSSKYAQAGMLVLTGISPGILECKHIK